MSEVLSNFLRVSSAVAQAAAGAGQTTQLVAVSKTHSADHIRPVLEAGHRIFGENRVQEAKAKWPPLRQHYAGIELHLIGPLQSNKAAEAVALFDVIQTVDRDKIARAIADEINQQKKSPKLLVQINTGREPQKAGVLPKDADAFLTRCRDVHGLRIDGLMCIPPADADPAPHFHMLRDLGRKHDLSILSMGMSSDFEAAITLGATHVRVGSAIFGLRESFKA